MRTGGYDVLVEVNERMLDRALAAMFHASLFSHFKGSVVPRSPIPLTGLARVDYDVRLREPPLIDLIPGDLVKLRASLAIQLKLGSRISVPVDVTANILTKVILDQGRRTLSVEILEMGVDDLRVRGRCAPSRSLLPLVNQVLSVVIRTNLLGEMAKAMGLTTFTLPASSLPPSEHIKAGRDIPVSLFPGFPGVTLEVPQLEVPLASLMPGEVSAGGRGSAAPTVTASHFGLVSSRCLAAAISFRDDGAGDPRGIRDFIGEGDVAVGLSQASICRILDDLWPYIPLTVRESGRVDVEDARELLDSLRGLLDFPAHLNALGLTKRTTRVAKAWVDYNALVTPDKPNIRLIDGGTIEMIGTMVDVQVKATARTRLQTTTYRGVNPFIPAWMAGRGRTEGPEATERDAVLYDFEQCLHVNINRAAVELTADRGRLMAKVADVDFDMEQICLPMALPKFVLDVITGMVERRLRGGYPPIDVTALLKDRVLSRAPVGLDLKVREVTGEGCELIIAADLEFRDVPDTVPTLPSFIADSRSRRVHRADCPSLRFVRERDKVGYTSLYTALSHGHLGADDCLSAYREGLDGDSAVGLPTFDIDLSGIIARGEGLSRKLAEAAKRCLPPEGPRKPSSTDKPCDGAVDEVKREGDEDRSAGPVEVPIPISGPEPPGPVDGEADRDEPSEVAGQVDGGEQRDDPQAEPRGQDRQ